ncbi:uncharacterized protein L201_005432 [Kwoniella dendrophila CBS 6074]|uniref:Ribosome biogenesis protein SLX9 n=1 Tax=Kwoniella dendrophila CBS 6074 TaxID=1295534 RepID=A0AAX4JYK6_9TREE
MASISARRHDMLRSSDQDDHGIDSQASIIPISTTNFNFDNEPLISKSKQQKQAEFQAAVQSAPHPYLIQSKSHIRREKRKVKNLNSSTNLSSIENALESVIPNFTSTTTSNKLNANKDDEDDNMNSISSRNKKSRDKKKQEEEEEEKEKKRKQIQREKGKIGEGKGKTLDEKKRRNVIQEASQRIPAVISHPAYKTNPWATIREHVGNTIATKK